MKVIRIIDPLELYGGEQVTGAILEFNGIAGDWYKERKEINFAFHLYASAARKSKGAVALAPEVQQADGNFLSMPHAVTPTEIFTKPILEIALGKLSAYLTMKGYEVEIVEI
jgi:hypothetical protein